jgi:hypothetical protein
MARASATIIIMKFLFDAAVDLPEYHTNDSPLSATWTNNALFHTTMSNQRTALRIEGFPPCKHNFQMEDNQFL